MIGKEVRRGGVGEERSARVCLELLLRLGHARRTSEEHPHALVVYLTPFVVRQGHLGQRIIEVIVLEQEMVKAEVLPVIGGKDDQGGVVEALGLENLEHASDLRIEFRKARVIESRRPAHAFFRQELVREVAAIEREVLRGGLWNPARQKRNGVRVVLMRPRFGRIKGVMRLDEPHHEEGR